MNEHESKNQGKVVVLLSGGVDSATVLAGCKQSFERSNIHAISLDYGQKHSKELDRARVIAASMGVEHTILSTDILKQLNSSSSLLAKNDIDIPKGHYADESMKSTVVPARNLVLASIAISFAAGNGYDHIALGVHAGDHDIYPDCRPAFISALKDVARCVDYEPIKILTPYLLRDKAAIVADGLSYGLDYSLTWTCYVGGEKPCGTCGSCVERLEAFAINNATDPLEYQDAE